MTTIGVAMEQTLALHRAVILAWSKGESHGESVYTFRAGMHLDKRGISALHACGPTYFADRLIVAYAHPESAGKSLYAVSEESNFPLVSADLAAIS